MNAIRGLLEVIIGLSLLALIICAAIIILGGGILLYTADELGHVVLSDHPFLRKSAAMALMSGGVLLISGFSRFIFDQE